jgi:hypothetical protein
VLPGLSCIVYVYFIVIRTGLLVVVCFLIRLGVKLGLIVPTCAVGLEFKVGGTVIIWLFVYELSLFFISC